MSRPSLALWTLLAALSGAPLSARAATPPLLLQDSPAFPPADAEERLPGCDVSVAITIDVRGDVAEARVLTPCHPLLDAAALEAAFGLRFEPAMEGHHAIPASLEWHFHFVPVDAHAGRVRNPLLSGVVRERGTRRPLPDAVLFVDGSETPLPTDAQGRFAVALPAGKHQLRVEAPQHRARGFEEVLHAKEELEVSYGLNPTAISPYETLVRDERPREEVSRIILSGPEIHEVAGTQGDPLRAVMLLPGVGTVVSGVSYPVVRGAQPGATGYTLDDIPIPVLFHLFVGPSVFNPDFISDFTFTPGEPPIESGRRMAGAVAAETNRPREDGTHGSAYLDLLNAGVFIDTTLGKAGQGPDLTVAARFGYTLLAAAIIANAVQSKPALADYSGTFWDYQGRLEQKLGPGKLRLLAFGSSDGVSKSPEEDSQTGLVAALRFHRADARWTSPFLGGDVEAGLTFGLDEVNLSTQNGFAASTGIFANRLGLRARLAWTRKLASNWTLKVGGDLERADAHTEISSTAFDANNLTQTYFLEPHTQAMLGGLYARLTGQVGKLLIIPGVRADSYHVFAGPQLWSADPRISLRLALSEQWTLKAGGALVHQPATVLLDAPVIDLGGLRAGLQSGAQSELGVEWRPLPQLEINLQGFYDPLFRAVEFDIEDLIRNAERGPEFAQVPATHGKAYGVELFVRKRMGEHWFAWASYTLSRSDRYATFGRYDDSGQVTSTAHAYVPFAFDETHIINAAVSYQFSNGYTVGVNLHYNSGRPESGQITSRDQRRGSDPSRAALGEDPAVWVPQDLDRVDRLPDIWRADLRLSKKWTHETHVIELYLDVLNVTFHWDTLGYDYNVHNGEGGPTFLTRQAVRLPLFVPMLGGKGSF